jgi:hypothetical protein
MARTRKSPTPAMKELDQKIAGMTAIDSSFDAGNGVTLAAAKAMKADADAALADYNSMLATVDEKYNAFTAKDKLVRGFNKKVLPAAGLKYGTDSSEYEQLGGKRDSERKKPVRKPKPTP